MGLVKRIISLTQQTVTVILETIDEESTLIELILKYRPK